MPSADEVEDRMPGASTCDMCGRQEGVLDDVVMETIGKLFFEKYIKRQLHGSGRTDNWFSRLTKNIYEQDS